MMLIGLSFFTTKPAGEGIDLSLSHDIIVKQQGGRIDAVSVPGSFTEIMIALLRNGAAPSNTGGRFPARQEIDLRFGA